MREDKYHKNSYSEEFLKEFGQRLRSLRLSKDLKINEVVTRLGLPRSTYSGWELGKRFPSRSNLSILVEFYDTTLDYLTLNTDDGTLANINLKDLVEKGHTLSWGENPVSKTKMQILIDLMEEDEH